MKHYFEQTIKKDLLLDVKAKEYIEKRAIIKFLESLPIHHLKIVSNFKILEKENLSAVKGCAYSDMLKERNEVLFKCELHFKND